MPTRMNVDTAVSSIQSMRAHLDQLAGNRRKLEKADIDDPLLHQLAQDSSVSGWDGDKVSVKDLRQLLGTMEAECKAADGDRDEQLGYHEVNTMSPLMTRILDRADPGSRVEVNDATKAIKRLRQRFENVVGEKRTINRSDIEDPALLIFANYNRSEEPPPRVSVRKMREQLDRVERKLKFVDLDANKKIGFSEMRFLGPQASEFLELVTNGIGSGGTNKPQDWLENQASAFVTVHSQDGFEHFPNVNDEIFPRLRSGENGLELYTLPDDAAQKMVALSLLASPDNPALQNFDPAQHMLFAVQTTGDEMSIIVNLMDRATGEAKSAYEMSLVDVAYDMPTADFESVMGPISEFGAETPQDIDQFDLSAALLQGSKSIEVLSPYGLEDALGYQIPFDNTEYEGWGNEPDFAIFSSPVATYENIAQGVGTLVVDGHYNSGLYDAGLSRDAVKALYKEIKNSCPDFEHREYKDFNISGVRKLYDDAGMHLGHEVRYSDPNGIIGASCYLTLDNEATYGLGS